MRPASSILAIALPLVCLVAAAAIALSLRMPPRSLPAINIVLACAVVSWAAIAAIKVHRDDDMR